MKRFYDIPVNLIIFTLSQNKSALARKITGNKYIFPALFDFSGVAPQGEWNFVMKKLNGCRVASRFFAVRTVRLDRAPLASIFDQIVSRRAKLIHHGRVAVVLFS